MEKKSSLSAFRRFIGSSNASKSNRTPPVSIAVGDRFLELENDQPVWIVERISTVSASHYPLVILRREGVAHMERTLSLAALEDVDSYRRTAQ